MNEKAKEAEILWKEIGVSYDAQPAPALPPSAETKPSGAPLSESRADARNNLQAWVFWALKNPMNEDQEMHAKATKALLDDVAALEHDLGVAKEAESAEEILKHKLTMTVQLHADAENEISRQAEEIEILVTALEWYSDGLYPGDESYVGNELRNGRRAREALSKIGRADEKEE